jgi:hypothetical protein
MPDIRFIERRDGAETIGRFGPFERGSVLFWREYRWQMEVASVSNRLRTSTDLSWQTVYVLDGDSNEITKLADF